MKKQLCIAALVALIFGVAVHAAEKSEHGDAPKAVTKAAKKELVDISAGQPVIRLWTIEQVGGEANRLKHDTTKEGKIRYRNVKDPHLVVFPVKSRKPAPAVVCCPGGGYKWLTLKPELIKWLNDCGITVFMLKYTVPDDRAAALRDVQRAMRLVRKNAVKWNIDPDQLGVLGTSAGGNLVLRLSQHYNEPAYPAFDAADKLSCEPAFVITGAAAYLWDRKTKKVADDFPMTGKIAPTFMVCALDDKQFGEGSVVYEKALKAAGGTTEIIISETGGHGLAKVNWFPACEKWLKAQGIKIKTVTNTPQSLHLQLIKGDLETSLRLMNLWGEQPAEKQEVLKQAYTYLRKSKDRTFAQLAEQPEFRALCEKAEMTHLGGPMLGSVSEEGARIWIRTLNPAKVEVRVGKKTYGPVLSTVASDLTAIVPVTGLKPSTRYPYTVWVDGKEISIPKHAAIMTAPKATTSGKVRIAFGSCYHRWGLGNPKQANLIRRRKPAALLLIGDIAVQDRNSHLGLHRVDNFYRDLMPAWNNLAARVPVYATWDDHDYFANDRAGISKGFTLQDKQGVCDVFEQSWNNPTFGFDDERRGVFTRTRIGPCDVIMTDNRYFRENKPGSFLGDEQMQWLEEQLLDCKGPFIILSCGSMWSDYVSNGKDSWGAWDPEGRERIFNLIEKNIIGGVLLISGDRHGARGFRIPRPSGFEFYEFEGGSLGGRSGPAATSNSWGTQLYGISGKYAFSEFSIDADLPDPEVTFRLIADTGDVMHELKLRRSELTPGEKD